MLQTCPKPRNNLLMPRPVGFYSGETRGRVTLEMGREVHPRRACFMCLLARGDGGPFCWNEPQITHYSGSRQCAIRRNSSSRSTPSTFCLPPPNRCIQLCVGCSPISIFAGKCNAKYVLSTCPLPSYQRSAFYGLKKTQNLKFILIRFPL